MTTTALILRPADSPKLWVLEVDGPRRRFTQRGEGSYYLATCNHPICDPISSLHDYGPDERLKDWDRPYWEIYQHLDGNIEVTANRPTIQETMRGDLHGRWGSSIFPKPNRTSMRIALRIARRLARCNPMEGITIQWYEASHLERIETDIPVFQQTTNGQNVTVPKSA
jgi:hypothetical protein